MLQMENLWLIGVPIYKHISVGISIPVLFVMALACDSGPGRQSLQRHYRYHLVCLSV